MSGYLWNGHTANRDYACESVPLCPAVENMDYQDGKGRWLINPLPRFAAIFRPLYAKADNLLTEEEREARDMAANLAFHALAQGDLLLGLSRARLEQIKILGKLAEGLYGDWARENFSRLDPGQQEKLAQLLYRQEKERRVYYLEALKAFFPGSRIYFYKDEQKLLIFLPYEESDSNKRLLDLVEYLFSEFACAEREYFWTLPFCIIGDKATLHVGNSVIY